MPQAFAALLAGTIFGLGLAVSGMINPAKVLAFLDVAGDWDPTLALVMAGALAVSGPGYALVRRRRKPVLGPSFQIPTRRVVDARLLTGATVFGVGWGMAGFCPGPALAALVTGAPQVFGFAAAMVVGMLIQQRAGAKPPPGR